MRFTLAHTNHDIKTKSNKYPKHAPKQNAKETNKDK